jgi:hypothetical protein
MGKELLALLVSCIDLEKLVLGLVEGIGEKALKDVAAKSATPIDDAVLAVLLPAINPAIESLLKAEIDKLKAAIAA